MSIFKLPDLGEGLPDAEIHEWHVKEGDVVKTDQLMVSMETAKAVVDVPAPQDGRIVKLHGQKGDIIETGAPLVEFESEGASPATSTEAVAENASTVVGAIEVTDTVLQESPTGVKPVKSKGPGIKAIPAVRALAKKMNIDLATVTGSGPNGQITADDVKAAANSATAELGNSHAQPLRGVRRAMALSMTKSHAEVVPVTLVDNADIHAWSEGNNITTRVIRAIAQACKKEPALNAWYNHQTMERQLFDSVHVGLAMDSDDGLFVPVLKDADKSSAQDLRAAINAFKAEVKDRTLAPEKMKGFTIMLSNFGTFAGRYANPVIVPPCVAILGTGRLFKEVALQDGQAVEHKIIPLSLTIDHRGVTGGEAARFLAAVIEDLQLSE